MDKEIYLSSKPPSQSSLNTNIDSERKVNIQPVSASLEPVKNDLDSQEKDKENKRKKVQNMGSFSSDYENEKQMNNENANHNTLSPSKLKAKLKESEDELAQYKRLYTEALKSIEDLKNSSNDLTAQLSSLTTENIRYKQDCDRARADLELAEENRLQAEQLVKVISTKLELAEKRHLLLLESVKKTQEKDDCDNDGEPSSTTDYAALYPNAPEDLLTLVNKLRSTNHSLTLQTTDLQNALDDLKKELETTHGAQLKAEKTIEKLRADLLRVQDEHETDYEATRSANQVKMRQLEETLEGVKQENARLNREKHQLELEISVLNTELANATTSNDDDMERKLLKELKLMKNLLAEKEVIIVQLTSNCDDYKEQIRKLRDRIDELDESNDKTNRQKRRQQSELEETQQQLTSALRTQKRFEEELSRLRRQLNELENQLADQEDAHKETRDKLTVALADITVNEATIQAQMEEINAFLIERKKLQAQIDELKLEINTTSIDQVPRSELERLETRIRELDQRLDSEITNRTRIQYSLDRARESIEQLTNERDKLISSEASVREQNRKLSRQLRLAQQEESEATRKATMAQRRVEEAQFDVHKALDDAACSRAEMNALQRRIQDLEAYINKAKHLKLAGDADDDDDDVDVDGDELGLYDSSGGDDVIGLRKLKGSQDLILRSTLRSSAEYSAYGCCSDAEDGVNGVGVGDVDGDMPNNHENNHCLTETNESRCPTVTTTTTTTTTKNSNNSSINTSNHNNNNNAISNDGSPSRFNRGLLHKFHLLNRALSDDNLPYYPNRLAYHMLKTNTATTTTASTITARSPSILNESSLPINPANISKSKNNNNKNKKQNSIKSKKYNSLPTGKSVSQSNSLQSLKNDSLETLKPQTSEEKLIQSSNFTSTNSFETVNTCSNDTEVNVSAITSTTTTAATTSTTVATPNNEYISDGGKSNETLTFSSNVCVLTTPRFKQTVTIKHLHHNCMPKPNVDVVYLTDNTKRNNNDTATTTTTNISCRRASNDSSSDIDNSNN
ncbi:unnamed protein product [Trichobilharzia szidati]|nr:unnamed protein product [Trichobilharzia szidati]